ncbi:MAG TPA: hypothetical protein VFE98_02915 [Candidatus Bathyarchaeia archaeon]|nr:hypothetical protein [Candidatus Bathyarchaeia archaeon]
MRKWKKKSVKPGNQADIDYLLKRVDELENRELERHNKKKAPQQYCDDWNKANAIEYGLDELFKRWVKRGVIV